MKVIKEGQQRLFETDQETVSTVSRMLLDLERNGMDAVRKYSLQFDEWDPPDFQLTPQQIDDAVASLPETGSSRYRLLPKQRPPLRPSATGNDAAARD